MREIGPVTYHLQRDHRDILVAFDPDSRRRIETALKLPPLKTFVDALDIAHQQFCPHVLPRKRPWDKHGKMATDYGSDLKEAIESLRNGRNRDRLLTKHKLIYGASPEGVCLDLPAQATALSEVERALPHDALAALGRRFRRRLQRNNVPLRTWPLTWYWKALFTALPSIHERELQFSETEPLIKVRISQVRNWTLVLVYSERVTRDENGYWVPVRTLLRPPLFGRSYRYATWDQYFSICGFQQLISKAWTPIDEEHVHDASVYREQWYVLGRHDMTFTVTSFRPQAGTRTIPHTLNAEVKLTLDLYPFRGESWEIKERRQKLFIGAPAVGKKERANARVKPPRRPDASYVRYPYDLVSIPVCQREAREGQKLRDGTVRNNEERILLASDCVCRAYESLSEIWNDPTAQSVLVIAPPGSGKELLSESIHRFQDHKGPYIRSALSPSLFERNDATLFSRDIQTLFKPRGDLLEEIMKLRDQQDEKLRKVFMETQEWSKKGEEPKDAAGQLKEQAHFETDGLVFKARSGVLFLDEIDKVPEQTRASLLRLLENDEFSLFGTSIMLKFKKWSPTYVFAGSLPRRDMFALKPADFWTRVSHVVEMQHPLDIDNDAERASVAKEYFVFFWIKHIPKFAEASRLLPFNYEEGTREYFQQHYQDLCGMLCDYDTVDCIGQMFADEIEIRAAATSISVRGIRSVVGRVIYSLVDHLLYNKSSESSLEAMREGETAKMTGWFEMLGWLIKWPLMSHPRNPRLAAIETEHGHKFRAEVRRIVQAAIGKIGI